MTAAIVVLAIVAAGALAAAAALAVRMVGMRGEMEHAALQLAAAKTEAEDSRRMAELANGETATLRDSHARLALAHRAELDALTDAAARCSDPAELRAMLTRLTSKGGPS